MRHILILPNGLEVSSGPYSENNIRSITTTETVNSGEELTIGSVCAAMMEASVINAGFDLQLTAGSSVTLVEETDGIRKQVGIFFIERPKRKTANILNLTGYDSVIKLDRDLTQWLVNLNAWPYTIYELAQMVCRECGLELATEKILNGEYLVEKFEVEATGRKLLSWIGEIACCFVKANSSGRIEFGWYREEELPINYGGPVAERYYFQNKLSYESYTVAEIDEVQVNMGNYRWPDVADGENVYLIEGNPLIQKNDKDTLEAIGKIRERLKETKYVPCTVEVPVNMDIIPGSICHIRDANGVDITTWIMSRVRKGMRDKLESTGSQRRDSATAQANKTEQQKAAEQKIYSKKVAKEATAYQESKEKIIIIDLENSEITINTNTNGTQGKITVSSLGVNVEGATIIIDGKTISWHDNGDGTYSLIGR